MVIYIFFDELTKGSTQGKEKKYLDGPRPRVLRDCTYNQW